MDINQVAIAVTAAIAFILSVGGVVVLNGRAKFVTAIESVVQILDGVSHITKDLIAAQADQVITPEELKELQDEAASILEDIKKLRDDLGV
jgi:cell shape-determining protein MreC